MSTGEHLDEASALRAKIAELQLELTQYKQKLIHSESRFRLLADAVPAMIWMSGEDGLCTFFNRAWLDFRGRHMEDEIGTRWLEGIHPEDRDMRLETYLRSFGSHKPFRVQYRLQREGGVYRWVEDTGMPRFEAPGQFAGFMGLAIDIDNHKHGVLTPDEEAVRLVLTLTERERQVLSLIACGKTTRDTAKELGISFKTADSHRSRILEKLNCHETATLVRYAIRSGLIEP